MDESHIREKLSQGAEALKNLIGCQALRPRHPLQASAFLRLQVLHDECLVRGIRVPVWPYSRLNQQWYRYVWTTSAVEWSNQPLELPEVQPPPPLTEEQLRARAAEDARWRAQQEATRIERQRARDRAELLLAESLSPRQLESFRLNARFEVATIDKQGRPRIFRIKRGRVANILELNAQGEPVTRWCVHPRLDVPDADTMLAQKLWLENDPDSLLAIANRHPLQ